MTIYHGMTAAGGILAAAGLEGGCSPMWRAIDAEGAEIRRALVDDSYRIPRGWYRAHKAIARGKCAHCAGTFYPRQTIGYNSLLPGRHKTICGLCFYGETRTVWAEGMTRAAVYVEEEE